MKDLKMLLILLMFVLVGIMIGSLLEKFVQDEPYLVFPVDTVTIYKDTLTHYIHYIHDDTVGWKSYNYTPASFLKINFEADTTDTVLLNVNYYFNNTDSTFSTLRY